MGGRGGSKRRMAKQRNSSKVRPMEQDEDDRRLLDPDQEHNEEEEPRVGHVGGHSAWAQLGSDKGSIALLLFLYMLQGIPLGLTASIPLVLSSRHVSYAQQAVFSFAYWPFSLKLFWAPIVDSLWSAKVGRRKSWLVPTQYLIGIFMLILSGHVTDVLGDSESDASPNVLLLTTIFFSFNFLAATQDIAVDGWALTMLSKENVGYASTCNAVGQTAGYFLGNVVFLALESADFCNKYIRTVPQATGVVTLAEFVYYWAWIFMVCTTLVFLLKTEKPEHDDHDLGIKETYKLLYRILKLHPVIWLVIIHLTNKVAFAAADGVTGLKLVDIGVPKDKMALLAIPLVPLQILLPWLIGKYTAGPRPLSVHLKAYPYRLVLGLVFAGVVYWTPEWKQADGTFPATYYALIVAVYCVHQVTVYCMFVAVMSFHAQISDPMVGGTYMTLMNTVSNLGGNWPVTLVLSLVEEMTWKDCYLEPHRNVTLGPCVNDAACKAQDGACVATVDGYYILSGICAVVGLIWWLCFRHRIHDLQWRKEMGFETLDKDQWSCSKRTKNRRK